MEAAARDLPHPLARESLDHARHQLVALAAVAQPPELALAPRENFSGFGQRGGVEAARGDLPHRPAAQRVERLGQVWWPSTSPPDDAVLLVAPSVHLAAREEHGRVARTARDLRNGLSGERVDAAGRRVPALVAVAELAVHAATPRVQLAVDRHGRRVVRAARRLHARRQRLDDARHVLPAVVAVPQPAVVAAPPREHEPVVGQDHGVSRAARDVLDAAARAQRLDQHRTRAVVCVAEAQLPVLAAAPAEHRHIVAAASIRRVDGVDRGEGAVDPGRFVPIGPDSWHGAG